MERAALRAGAGLSDPERWDASWVDRTSYPFAPHYFDTPEGRMHYVDEGDGPAILMVHGTTTWSFLYRDLIRSLTAIGYRCIAPDHLGYGLSEKPEQADYRPEAHARRLHALIRHLRLRDLTLIVHDFGGPIGLSYAVEEPDNVRSLVLFNTWMWSLRGAPFAELAGRLSRGRLGRLFLKDLNLEMRVLFRMVWGNRSKLDRAVYEQYMKPLSQPCDRQSLLVLARELLASSDWYATLWNRRERIQDIPALLLWGLKDPVFGPRYLVRWQELFTAAQTITFPSAGHYVQEEERGSKEGPLRQFLQLRSRVAPHDR
jgi:pimeloyl-ACP methyl ester carboxylesterase